MTADQKAQEYAYSKRVYPSISALLPIALVAPSVALVVLPFLSDLAAITLGLVVAIALLAFVLVKAPLVTVTVGAEPTLQVGRARVPLKFIEKAEVVAGEKERFEKGPGLNANAYFVNQAGTKALVKVTLNDKNDSTPYWLFACNEPDDLVVALRANR